MIRHLPVIAGVALPIAFIIVIVLIAYVPTLSVKPAHDFIYADGNTQGYSYERYAHYYAVEAGRIVRYPNGSDENARIVGEAPQLYYYDVDQNVTHEISYDQARVLQVTAGPSSPDGYIVEYRYSSDGIFGLFGGGSGNAGYYVTKDGAAKRLPALQSARQYYMGGFEVIGWIE